MEEGKNHPKGSGHGGKYTRLPKEYREKLSSALPREAIKKHPTKTFLSTIKQIFITERLNDVFGVGGWDFEHNIVGVYDNDTYTRTKTKSGKVNNVIVGGRLYSREFDLYTPLQYGGGDIEGYNTDPSDGFKGAVTDCMSKCASLWEIGIQVFKGKPNDQTGNKSLKTDENDEIAELLKDAFEKHDNIEIVEDIVYTNEYLRLNFPTTESLFTVLNKLSLDPSNIDGDEYDDYISAILNTQEFTEKKVEVQKPKPKKKIEQKVVEELSPEDAKEVISLMVGWDKLIPPLNKDGKRAVSKQKLVYDQLLKVGVNDANCVDYMAELGLSYDNKKELCKTAPKEAILSIAELHKNNA